jgi:RNA polymerase sigma-70 factor (ECF subfamily)
MPQADIARELGISITSVKRHQVKTGMQCYFAGKL